MNKIKINNSDTILYGEESEKVYIYVHGQGGNAREAARFAEIAAEGGYQVISFDLPEHGERKDDAEFLPWVVRKELDEIAKFAFKRWKTVSVRATSIGAYFSLLSFKNYGMERCLFVSPLLDMVRTISDLMTWSGVTEERLRTEKVIPTNFGRTLSWDYLCFARENPVAAFADTRILYADGDEVVPRETVEKFSDENRCRLTVLAAGEHWLHTPCDERAMGEWERNNI